MKLSLKRANARAKAVWNDPKWKRSENKEEQPEEPTEEEIDYDPFLPIVDQDGQVWRRTISAPPPWRR